MRSNIIIRMLERHEVKTVWQIERREIVHEIYRSVGGKLRLQPEFYDVQDWPEGEPEIYMPLLLDCFDHGGIFLGAYAGEQLVAVAVTDARPGQDYPEVRQLSFLHVSHGWRGQGLASNLYRQSMSAAQERGAKGLYISSTPTRRTVEFYLQKGALPVLRPDETLYALEPEDIHLIHRF
ncbi:GNAT family N-acetyltransferase [Pseudochrobactrum sp. sp1633]|uniref:GNAT family N-acetyltransferase n=1 Tax=Pseudochrobactrum sp. sp1633 TaxID=3036706 RepID=UPI0025A55FA4|nr:GNAT family N-acetyltransferase [Pseudochrobactrum sp. sp1633]MDM8344581.1 GNAT family N-acetyltransferase [Pseudochrobactrum sp. sp1633]HWD13658.1 GNAT family N-acetyltransferase [Pseudochrobactrum sp.]